MMLLHILKMKWTPRFQQAIFVLSRPPDRFRTNNPKSPPHLPGLLAQVNSFILFLHQHVSPPFNSSSHLSRTVDSTPNFRCHELWSATYTIRLLTLLVIGGGGAMLKFLQATLLGEGKFSPKTKCWVEIGGAYQIVPQIFQNT